MVMVGTVVLVVVEAVVLVVVGPNDISAAPGDAAVGIGATPAATMGHDGQR